MIDPYTTPNTPEVKSVQRKSRWRVLKHVFAFLVILLVVNRDKYFGSPEVDAEVPQVSITVLVLFYGLGYAMFSRVRSRR
jgi:hypothetical protein